MAPESLRERILEVVGLLEDGSPDAPGLEAAAAAVNDDRLTEAISRYRSGDADALEDALWRAGELLLDGEATV
jgi:hypothetical protein